MVDLNAWTVIHAGADIDDELRGLPIEIRVKQGMALLDERGPERWWELVDVDTLRLRETCQCVLGQLYGDYADGAVALGHFYPPDYGFILRPVNNTRSLAAYEEAWDELTLAWRDAIEARRLEEAGP